MSIRNIFCSTNGNKIRGKRIFESLHCPFEMPPSLHWPPGPSGWCSSALKRTMYDFKNSSFLIFSLFIEQNIFFPEICFAYTISEPKFTVWISFDLLE